MTKRSLLCLLLLAAVVLTGRGQTGRQPVERDIYVFGFATSFADSAAFITEVQPLRAYIKSNGFLANRSLYSLQLENYLMSAKHRENMTCAVFFSTKRSKAEKKYQKVGKRFRENQISELQKLRNDEFHFEPEELTEETAVYGEVAPEKKKKESKKPKKK